MNMHTQLEFRPVQTRDRGPWIWRLLFTLMTAAALGLPGLTPPANAGLPEPDSIVFGRIVIEDVPVTAEDVGVRVEARRTVDGPAFAVYRMGEDPALGDFYALRIPTESAVPLEDPSALVPGSTVHVVLIDESGADANQRMFTVDRRGQIERADFIVGGSGGDSDGNGLPDDWERAFFGGVGVDPNGDRDGDGDRNISEYTSGTDPIDGDDFFALGITAAGTRYRVFFLGRSAEGAGYAGKTRVYRVETGGLAGGDWAPVPGGDRVVAAGEPIVFEGSATDDTGFFRARVVLEDQ